MQSESRDFVHVLLFQCMNCGLPVANALKTDSRDLENVDLKFHDIVCGCGWTGQASGLEAKRHWVEPWHYRIERTSPSD
jgi:hypothetical protein